MQQRGLGVGRPWQQVREVLDQDDRGPQLAPAPPPAPVLATSAYDIDRRDINARIAQIIRDNARADGAPVAAE